SWYLRRIGPWECCPPMSGTQAGGLRFARPDAWPEDQEWVPSVPPSSTARLSTPGADRNGGVWPRASANRSDRPDLCFGTVPARECRQNGVSCYTLADPLWNGMKRNNLTAAVKRG